MFATISVWDCRLEWVNHFGTYVMWTMNLFNPGILTVLITFHNGIIKTRFSNFEPALRSVRGVMETICIITLLYQSLLVWIKLWSGAFYFIWAAVAQWLEKLAWYQKDPQFNTQDQQEEMWVGLVSTARSPPSTLISEVPLSRTTNPFRSRSR